jgi:hypothetical protein
MMVIWHSERTCEEIKKSHKIISPPFQKLFLLPLYDKQLAAVARVLKP